MFNDVFRLEWSVKVGETFQHMLLPVCSNFILLVFKLFNPFFINQNVDSFIFVVPLHTALNRAPKTKKTTNKKTVEYDID